MFYLFNLPKAFKGLLIASIAWLLLIISSPFANGLIKNLERQYTCFNLANYPELNESKVNIVSLGAGYVYDTTLVPTQQLSGNVLKRLTEAYRIYREIPNAKLITSGPNTNGFISQGEVVANAAVELGVPPEDTAYLRKPVNTQTEAKLYSQRFPDQEKVIIATDATHMPRAMFWFRHYGNEPIPAPTNYKIKVDAYDSDPQFNVGINNIDLLRKAIKEYVGLWYAKWKTGNLF